MCNVLPNRRMAFTVLLSVLAVGCGIKYATNKVLSNPEAINKVGAVYDKLNPRDTTERLYFIQGDSIITHSTDTVTLHTTDSIKTTDKVYINNRVLVRRIDTLIKQLPPDNRAMVRLLDSLGKYTNELNQAKGNLTAKDKALKTAENRLLCGAGIVLVLGIIIGLLLRFKVKM